MIDVKIIVLNSLLSEESLKVAMWHELGHAILHPEDDSFCFLSELQIKKSKPEREANLFACIGLACSNDYEIVIPDLEVLTNKKIHEMLKTFAEPNCI